MRQSPAGSAGPRSGPPPASSGARSPRATAVTHAARSPPRRRTDSSTGSKSLDWIPTLRQISATRSPACTSRKHRYDLLFRVSLLGHCPCLLSRTFAQAYLWFHWYIFRGHGDPDEKLFHIARLVKPAYNKSRIWIVKGDSDSKLCGEICCTAFGKMEIDPCVRNRREPGS